MNYPNKLNVKVGDMVECIDSPFSGNAGPRPYNTYVVKSISGDGRYLGIAIPSLCNDYSENVRSGSHPNWGINLFRKMRKTYHCPACKSSTMSAVRPISKWCNQIQVHTCPRCGFYEEYNVD